MSDVMLLGILRMLPEIWNGSQLDVNQRHSRYIQAADRIESDAERIEALERQLKTANESKGFISVDDLVNSIAVTDEDKKLAEEYRKQIREYFANSLEGK